MEFFEALSTSDFLQRAVLAGLLASAACGVVGSYVVVRRITYLAAGVAHATLGGMGVARYLSTVHGMTYLQPMHGALAAALLGAATIGWVRLRFRGREDTAISALWAMSMAVGILFISRTPGYTEDLMSYLFGNILLVSREDLRSMGLLDVLVVGLGVFYYNKFQAVCFDAEFAKLRGVSAEFYYLLLLSLVALTVVLLVTVVGLVLVIALLALPVAVAGHVAGRLWQLMVLSAILCALLTSGGLWASYGPELPAGATTVTLAGLLYVLVAVCRGLVSRKRRSSS